MLKTIKIVYSDDWVMVLDKPPGLLTVSTKEKDYSLTDILNKEFSKEYPKVRFYPCHRLDRETSGLIIFAKSQDIQDDFSILFKERKINKTYLAFVQGRLKQNQFFIDDKIEGKPSKTLVDVIKFYKDFSFVKVKPLTGRTNQIRIHFRNIGHPLVGERKFSFAKDYSLKFRRAALHASEIEFPHPMLKKSVFLKSDLPLDMKNFLEGEKV